jgi:hypothetical protein
MPMNSKVQQPLGDDTYDAQHHRHDHQQQEEGNNPILRSVGRLSGGPSRWIVTQLVTHSHLATEATTTCARR